MRSENKYGKALRSGRPKFTAHAQAQRTQARLRILRTVPATVLAHRDRIEMSKTAAARQREAARQEQRITQARARWQKRQQPRQASK